MRCRGPLEANPLHIDGTPTDAATDPLPFCYDPWEMDEQLHHIRRLLKTETVLSGDELDGATKAAYERELAQLDPCHPSLFSVQPPAARAMANRPTFLYRTLAAIAIGLTLCLGAVALVCGAALLGWSLAAGRHDLWIVGLPVTVGGQVVLLVGLTLQWRRLPALARPRKADKKFDAPRTAATARVDPKHVLGDLKDQLDTLAIKIGR